MESCSARRSVAFAAVLALARYARYTLSDCRSGSTWACSLEEVEGNERPSAGLEEHRGSEDWATRELCFIAVGFKVLWAASGEGTVVEIFRVFRAGGMEFWTTVILVVWERVGQRVRKKRNSGSGGDNIETKRTAGLAEPLFLATLVAEDFDQILEEGNILRILFRPKDDRKIGENIGNNRFSRLA